MVICRDCVVFFVAFTVCSCGSAPPVRTEAAVRGEIDRVLAEADPAIHQTCRGLVIDLQEPPVGSGSLHPAAQAAAGAAILIGLVVLIPLMVYAGGPGTLIGPGGLLRGVPSTAPRSPELSEAEKKVRANSLARDRITARCVTVLTTEQTVGPNHVDMAAPLVQLSEAYRLAAVEPEGPAMKQAERLYQRASSIADTELARADIDAKYGKQIERSILSYIWTLRESHRDWSQVCSRSERLRGSGNLAMWRWACD
jgi:hypothetical protein